MAMVQTINLTKRYGDHIAVDNLSFTVKPGDVVGFLGPNGAGKSTTMKMLTGYLSPTSGHILYNGESFVEKQRQIKQHIGYLPEGAPAYDEMTPFQFLKFIAQVRQIPKSIIPQKIDQVVRLVDLGSVLDKPIEQLSKGFKRRVGLAQAIIHEPTILILDEPTDGLDPNQKYQVRKLIQNLAKNKIVIVSTHILEEVSAVCNRVMVIANGQIKFDDTPHALRKSSNYFQAVSIKLASACDMAHWGVPKGYNKWELDESKNLLTFFPDDSGSHINQVQNWLIDKEISIDSLVLEEGRIEQVFRHLTQEKNR